MAIRGSLKEASLPDVLQLLSMGRKTGCLSVTDRNNFGAIYFDKGHIAYASIVNRRDRLGDLLVHNGLLTPAQLAAAVAEQGDRQDGRRLGEILVERGDLTREDLHRLIRVQIEEAVYFLFTWTQGTFNFEADIRPEERDHLVAINPQSLLLEGARRVDEWALIEKKIPSFDVVFQVDRGRLAAASVALTDEQQLLVPLLDGQRDVQALVDESGLVEFAVGKALYGLVSAGFLHRVGKTVATEALPPDARVEEHRNLGIAFFRTGMFDEAQREFRRVLALRVDDAQAHQVLGLVHARQGRWADAAAALDRASRARGAKPAVWHDLAVARSQLGQLTEAQTALDEAMRRGGDRDPRVLTTAGVLALAAGRVEAADEVLTAARALGDGTPPAAAWFHYAAVAAALVGEHDRAVALLQEGIEVHPRSAVLYNNLAFLLEHLGRDGEAMEAIDLGLAEDAALPQLHRNAGDLLYRQGRGDEALEAYLRAVRAQEGLGPEVWLRIGDLRQARGEDHEAAAAWRRVLALAPDHRIASQNLTALRARG